MDVKNLVMAVVGLVLAAVMIGGSLLPAVSSAIDVESEKINNSTNFYRSAVGSDNIEIIGDNTGTLTISGESYVMAGTLTQIFITSDFDIYMNQAGRIVVSYYDGTNGAELDNVQSFNATINDMVVNATFIDSESVTHTIANLKVEWAFIYTNDINAGWAFVTAGTSTTINVNDLSQVYISGYNTNAGKFFSVNGANISLNGAIGGTITYNEVKVDGYTNYERFTISSTNPIISIPTDGDPITIRPYYLIVPSEISVISDVNAPAVAMFSVLPLVAIAGLVMAGVYIFISRK